MEKHDVKIGATVTFNIRRMSNGEPLDLTGWDIISFLRHPKFGKVELTVSDLVPSEGSLNLILDETVSSTMVPAEYIWDIKYIKPDGDVEIFPRDNSVIFNFIKGAS